MISAMSENRVIGKDNDLPWHLPDDFKFFKETTKGHIVVLGRKNYESLPHKFRPLPDRTNAILTRNKGYNADGAIIFHTLADIFEYAKKNNEDELFIIGGGEIYKMGLEFCNRIYLTEIDAIIEGDTFFPEFDKSIWKETSRKHHPADERHKFDFDFVIYEKR